MAAADPPFEITQLPRVAGAQDPVKRQRMIASLKEILSRLRKAPVEWGDPQYHTKKLGGLVYRGFHPPFVVHFVVYEMEHVVCILKIRFLPDW
jgi:hypothetical protein